jgi:hypothetical protein
MLMEAKIQHTIVVTLKIDEQDLQMLLMMRGVHVPENVLRTYGITPTDLETWRDHVARVCAMAGDD